MNMSFRSNIPTEFIFGTGSLGRLSRYKFPGERALIVTGRGKSIRENGWLDKICDGLGKAGVGYSIFSGAEPNPTTENVAEGAKAAREEKCDFIIGLGGGSAIDCAKAIAVMVRNPGELWDYMYGTTGGRKAPEEPILPVVAIPTTAGTGSEMNNCAVISKNETQEKLGFVNEGIYPKMAIVDPSITASVPPKFTAYQGFDALMHACESIVNKKEHFYGYMHAIKAVELAAKYLPTAVADGADAEAREGLALAASFAGMYMMVTAEHAIEHAMSAFHPELPHGAGLILISDAYWNAVSESHTCDAELCGMAKAMGRADGSFTAALAELKEKCGIADLKMSDFGIAENEAAAIAENARATMGVLFINDPMRPKTEDVLSILERSF